MVTEGFLEVLVLWCSEVIDNILEVLQEFLMVGCLKDVLDGSSGL